MLKPALTVSLKVGEDPFIYSGWDNGGSTGYTWKVDVSSNAIGYFQTKNDQRSTAHLCGGGMAFEYQFHPLQVGSSEVKIFHGRPWENNNGDTPKETILFHVGALNEEESSTLDALVQQEQEKLEAFQFEANNLNIEMVPQEPPTTTDTSTTTGALLFFIRAKCAVLEPRLDRHHKKVALNNEHEAVMKKLTEEYKAIVAESKKVEQQQRRLVQQLSELTETMQLSDQGLRQARSRIAHPLGTSAEEMKRLDELYEINQNIQTEKENLTNMQEGVAGMQSQVDATAAAASGDEKKKK